MKIETDEGYEPSLWKTFGLVSLVTLTSLPVFNTGIGYLVTRNNLNNESKEIGREKAKEITEDYMSSEIPMRVIIYGNNLAAKKYLNDALGSNE